MKQYLQLTDSCRKPGSYSRGQLKKDVLYGFFRYKELSITFAKKSGIPTRVKDTLADSLVHRGLISPAQKDAYLQQVIARFATADLVEQYDDCTLEELYTLIHQIRKFCLGTEVLEQEKDMAAREPVNFDPMGCIDQRPLFNTMVQNSSAVIFALCQPQFFEIFKKDLESAQNQNKEIYILVSPQPGNTLPTHQALCNRLHNDALHFLETQGEQVDYDPVLQQLVDRGEACLVVYGEDGLLHCRDLRIDAAVYAIPTGYYAQAVTNQLGIVRSCAVFVPKHFDITEYAKLRERTRISYWQLAKLWEAYGAEIYRHSPAQLYEKYPRYFINIYQNGSVFEPSPINPETSHCPDPMGQFDALREQAIGVYLNGFSNIKYQAAYFDTELNQQPICTDSTQTQPGVLVHAVRVTRAKESRVIRCQKNTPLRQMFTGGETGIVSNFLFFMTPSLATLYNDLRADRPMEQANVATGHLDYMLCYQEGKRTETFPLFRKTCIAMKENGEFFFFNFRLGGGSIHVAGHHLRWEQSQVDAGFDSPICVYTPYGSLPDGDADRQTYRKIVGKNRVNLVILQDRICAIRKGDVVLPSVGVVISLDEATAASILEQLSSLDSGYYDVSGLDLCVHLDPPQGIDPATWSQVRWSYGGGLSLILDGVGLCDGDHMDAWFTSDGWKSPLSRQTQESTLHELVKHPRTAIGTLENGDLVVLVFSGRTWRSTGADYQQMITIARKLFGNVNYLMNMDGGGSAVLGMVCNGSFMELSCPSTSTGSCVGMVRPINTVLYIPAEEEEI